MRALALIAILVAFAAAAYIVAVAWAAWARRHRKWRPEVRNGPRGMMIVVERGKDRRTVKHLPQAKDALDFRLDLEDAMSEAEEVAKVLNRRRP